ncbi:MAG TPA: phosphoadenosine phosphosulfate reductase family protein [Minicystis sp.]|nr:phosphoadenosine phosphosulfate reductase family protein [Minicystis sp.]
MLVSSKDLEKLNQRFENAPPLDVLRFVHAEFGPRAAILSSMQRPGTVLCHMADRAGLTFDVLFVDTGLLHPETHATKEALAKTHPNLRVVPLTPERSFMQQCGEEGVLYLTREGQERCCDLRKRQPLLQARGRYDAVIGALRREEGGARSRTKTFALDPALGALRVHPFVLFTKALLDQYVAEHPDCVVNPLHAMGFRTIGCYPCTTPVLPTEGRRAGRWRHLASVEYCGINPSDLGAVTGSIELDDRYADLFA